MIGCDSSPSASSSSSAESSFRELDDVFLQTQTRIWLGEVLHARLDDQQTISDLLADGELLFEVSKIIWTMLLAKCKELRHVKGHKYKPVDSRKSSGRYRPYSNVDSFLKICKILGLNGIDLVSPSDVVEKRDTRKVCICIRSLSKRARSKQLNVPDFDIVTYAVTMPTNMVGCLRRSLEPAQCSLTDSTDCTPYKVSTSKFRKKNQVAVRDRNFDSCSEASDDSECSYMAVPSYSSSTNYSHDTALLVYSDVENSPEVSSVLNKDNSALALSQEEIQCQEKEKYGERILESASLMKPALGSQYVQSDYQLYGMSSCDDSQMTALGLNNGGRHIHEMAGLDLIDGDSGFGDDASIVGEFFDDNTNQFSFPELVVSGTDNRNLFLFEGEDIIFNLLMRTDSHRSNSTGRTSQNGFGRRFCDEFEDVEVSSVNSLSSVLGRAMQMDFDDQSNADDLRTAKVSLIDLQYYDADSLDRSSRGYEFQDITDDENSVHILNPDTERFHFETRVGECDFSTELSSPSQNCWHSHSMQCQEYAGSFINGTGVSQTNSEVLLLKDADLTVIDNDMEVNNVKMVELDPLVRKYKSNCLSVASCGNVMDVKYEDSIVACDSVAAEGGELSHNIDSALKHWDITTRDIDSQHIHKLYTVSVDNTAVNHDFVIPEYPSHPTAEKHPCSFVGGSDSVDENGHQACVVDNGDVYCAEYMNEDESKLENVDNPSELSEGRRYNAVSPPQRKPHRKPLLRTFVKGTALVGLLCLLLHLRSKNGRDKIGEVHKQYIEIQKANGLEFTSRKEQKGGGVNGIYPAEKLKFEN